MIVTVLHMQLLGMSYPDEQNYSVHSIEEIMSISDIDIEFCQRQNESIYQYQSMLESFNKKAGARSNNVQVYDSNYGGAYIDDNGNLVVLLVDDSSDEIAVVGEMTGNAVIITEKCEYSFNELISVIDTINGHLTYLSNCGVTITEMYEDVCDNRVYIGIYDLTEEKESIVREIIDHPCMEIYKQNNTIKENVDIKGGYGISGSGMEGTSTVGFCATRGNSYGFVIAGHAVANLYDNFTYAGTSIGYVTANACYDYTTADAAFLTKSTYATTTPYINVYTCHYLGTSISDFPAQALIYKYGATTGLTSAMMLCQFFQNIIIL